jgi:hypothetical protein
MWANRRPFTPFGYLFHDLAARFPAGHLPGDPAQVTAALEALGEALAEAPAPDEQVGNSTISPVYTYWGQFIDHDITANTDRQNSVTDLTIQPVWPVPPDQVRRKLRNLRQPALNQIDTQRTRRLEPRAGGAAAQRRAHRDHL